MHAYLISKSKNKLNQQNQNRVGWKNYKLNNISICIIHQGVLDKLDLFCYCNYRLHILSFSRIFKNMLRKSAFQNFETSLQKYGSFIS